MKIKIQIIILIATSFAYSQRLELPSDYIRQKALDENSLPKDVTGSKYLDDEFKQGNLTLNGRIINGLIRFDLLKNEFELKNPENNQIVTLSRSEDLKVQIGKYKYEMRSYKDKNQTSIKYFQILNEGQYELIKDLAVEFQEAKPAANSYTQPTPAKFEKEEEYLLISGSNPAQELKRFKKNDILDILNSEKANSYVKSQNLKLKSEEEVIELLDYLNKNF